MARIAGIDIPREKRVEIALTYVYGIGLTRSKLILANTGVNPDIRVKDLWILMCKNLELLQRNLP